MTVFISGKMSGVANYNRDAFFAAEGELRAQGHKVLNPAVLPTDLPETAYMPICLAMLDVCDAIYMLTGYEDSLGAGIELSYARRQGKIVLQQEDADE